MYFLIYCPNKELYSKIIGRRLILRYNCLFKSNTILINILDIYKTSSKITWCTRRAELSNRLLFRLEDSKQIVYMFVPWSGILEKLTQHREHHSFYHRRSFLDHYKTHNKGLNVREQIELYTEVNIWNTKA